MIVAVDAQYGEDLAATAYVVFEEWTDPLAAEEATLLVDGVEDYTPGEFWRRELPCIQAALARLDAMPDIVVVDGHVWLDENARKGLGAHLYDALDGAASVVGVAKRAFRGATGCAEVYRGGSSRPLYVSAVGMELSVAAAAVASMQGAHRLPTLLKRVDSLAREGLLSRSR